VVSQFKDSSWRKKLQTQLSQEAGNGLLFLEIHFDLLQKSRAVHKLPEQCRAAYSPTVL